MKTKRKFTISNLLPLCILFISTMSCSHSNSQNQNVTETDTITISCNTDTTDTLSNEKNHVKIESFLNELYADYIFGKKNFNQIKNHFSEKILSKLKDAYDYDDGGYATWLFRSGLQDGPSDISKVDKISEDSDGWYTIEMTDMGNKAKCRFKAVVENDNVIITDFENISKNL